nr:hypothetical protein [Tanacetum cinerariifolium]
MESLELQEACEQLFEGLLVGGSIVVGLGIDQDTSSEIPNVNLENAEIPNVNLKNVENPNVKLENVKIPNVNLKNVAMNIDDDTEPIQVWNHYSQHLDAKENDFYSSLMRDVGQDVTTPCPYEISKQPYMSKNVTTKPKIVEMKRKGRNSGGTKLFQGYMAKQEEKQEHIIKILEFDAFGASKDDPYSVSRCMIVINGMVNMINMDIQRRNRKRKHGCAHFLLDSMYSCDLVSAYYYKYMHKEPCMTSSQTGEAWIKEVLSGNPILCVNAFRMHPNVFLKLCGELESSYGLKSSDKMLAVEKLGIFVYTLALGVSNRDVGERFQRSCEIISRAFHEVLEVITARSKGIPTFNVMAVCDFDLCFTFISVGWEGSAHDTRVFLHALNNPSMNFPKPPEDYMGCDELHDVRGSVTNNDNISSGTFNEMKQIRNDIATSIWNARRR